MPYSVLAVLVFDVFKNTFCGGSALNSQRATSCLCFCCYPTTRQLFSYRATCAVIAFRLSLGHTCRTQGGPAQMHPALGDCSRQRRCASHGPHCRSQSRAKHEHFCHFPEQAQLAPYHRRSPAPAKLYGAAPAIEPGTFRALHKFARDASPPSSLSPSASAPPSSSSTCG